MVAVVSHGVPPPLGCRKIGCRELATHRFHLCRHHWLELVEQAFRHEIARSR